MDKRLALVDALLTLGKQCETVAKLLSINALGDLEQDTLITLTQSNEFIDVAKQPYWPEIDQKPALTNKFHEEATTIPDLKVLEFNAGDSLPVTTNYKHAIVDLIVDDFKFPARPVNIRLISWKETKEYDIGIINESLEFVNDPGIILTKFKQCCKKIIIRLRPWTSHNGAFQSNKAYAHLVMPIDTKVKFKVVRPIATYESLFAKIGLIVEERQIWNRIPNEFFNNDSFLDMAIKRTWGSLKKEDALRIITTETIDYVVTP